MMKAYTIRYISGKSLKPCFDSQLACNMIGAYDSHKLHHPDSKHVEIRRPNGNGWLKIGNDCYE